MEIKTCAKCGANWINGQLFWASGAVAKEEDLAGIVCNNLGDDTCINPQRGCVTGDSWEKRARVAEKELDAWDKRDV